MSLLLLNLVSAVLLLLWATSFVSSSIIKTFGGQVRTLLNTYITNPFSGFLSGFSATALLQSSTATALMTASFIERRMIKLPLAFAVIIGADLSTTIIAQILIFDLSWVSPLLISIGAALTLGKSNTDAKTKAIGKALVGLGLILLALSLIKMNAAPLKDSPIIVDIIEALSRDAFMTILFSALITFALQSSLATILFYATLASQGLINAELGILLVIGANIGSASIPFFYTRNSGLEKERLFTVNLLLKCSMAMIAFLSLPFLKELLYTWFETPDRLLIMYHTFFNAAIALLFLPLTPLLARFAVALIKEPNKPRIPEKRNFFDDSALDSPSMALGNAMRATLAMAELIAEMTQMSFNALKKSDTLTLQYAKDKDDELDKLYSQTTLYLTKLSHETLTETENRQYELIMNFATNLEHSGDIIQHSMSKTILKKIKLDHNFSDEGWNEITDFYQRVVTAIKTSESIFMSQSLELSEELILHKQEMKEIERLSRKNHFNRLIDKNPASLMTKDIHIDLIRDLGRIASHVTSVAYDTLNHKDDLGR